MNLFDVGVRCVMISPSISAPLGINCLILDCSQILDQIRDSLDNLPSSVTICCICQIVDMQYSAGLDDNVTPGLMSAL